MKRRKLPMGPEVTWATIIWFDQYPELLERAVLSLEGRCAGVIAVDGAFAGLRDDPRSPLEQYEAVHEAARTAGLDCIIGAGVHYASEPEKRTAAAQWVVRQRPAVRWVLIVDSDEHVTSDVEWGIVEASEYIGCARIRTIGEEGEAVMNRLIPLTPLLAWGPKHYDLYDGQRVYSGWETGVVSDLVPALEMVHDTRAKKIEAEYYDYNDHRRAKAEGGFQMRIRKIEGDIVEYRMDMKTASDFAVGRKVKLDARYAGIHDDVYEVTDRVAEDEDGCAVTLKRTAVT